MLKFIPLSFFFSLLTIQVFQGSARADVLCNEQWFVGDKSQPDTTMPCKVRKLDERGLYFAIIDGKAYYHVTVDEAFTEVRRGLFKNHKTTSINEQRNFWPLAGAIQLDRLRTWSRAGRSAPRYATDDLRVFYEWRAIEGVDIASFEVLNARLSTDPPDSDETSDDSYWARDKSHLYFRGKSVSHALPDDVRRIGQNLIASNGRVFEIEFDGIKERPDMDATLHRLNWAYSLDEKHVYFRGNVVKGADPHTFEIMKPECPLKGHPNLHCDPAAKFDEDRRKAGFTLAGSPPAAGTYYWWGKDKNYVYQNGDRYEPWQDGSKKALSADNIRFFLLPGKTTSYFNPTTQAHEFYRVSEVYLINQMHLYYENPAIVTTSSSLRYYGSLSGPLEPLDNATLQDDQGKFSASMRVRYSPR